MIYHDLNSGKATVYGTKRLFFDQIAAAHLHKNRHYQWVLVEAYEAFESFLEHIYAAMGFADINFWPMSDFGNVRVPDITTKDFEWFLKQVKNKKNKPNSILSNFRNAFQGLRKIEVNNKCDVHAAFEVCLISKLRHLIVHNSGRVENKEEVVLRMLSDAAINDKQKESLTTKANMFFKKVKGTEDVHVYLVAEVFWWFQETNVAHGPDYTIIDAQMRAANALAMEAQAFLLCHEIGHIASDTPGMLEELSEDMHGVEFATHLDEFVADFFGSLFVLGTREDEHPSPNAIDLQFRYAGVEFVLQIYECLERVGIDFGNTHPPAAEVLAYSCRKPCVVTRQEIRNETEKQSRFNHGWYIGHRFGSSKAFFELKARRL